MKKYAVYKSDTGFYFYDYIDSPDALSGTDFENIITEDNLPVVLDGRGGYSRFSENDLGFDRIIETDQYPPLSIDEMFFKNHPDFRLGWMSPEGDTYSCSYTNHTKCARFLADEFFPNSRFPESTLQRGGWLKIIDSWDGTQRTHGQFVHSDIGYITRKQADRLFDLGLYKNDEVKELIKKNENNW
ncbi:MAG: hypothetical protein MJ081_02290 [Ruminococcus sp.]|nr:hypothetical protein [Ruminococcus sp.]